jgi:hypothetical protein
VPEQPRTGGAPGVRGAISSLTVVTLPMQSTAAPGGAGADRGDAGLIEHRFADKKPLPSTYSASDRTVDAIISMGSAVKRFYGTEILRIAPDAVIIDRLIGSGIPLEASAASFMATVRP